MSEASAVVRPEIGKSIVAKGLKTNYLEAGSGTPIVLIHGSGPGVSAWANWRLVIDKVASNARVIAIDMAGFGFTELEPGAKYTMPYWLEHLTAFLDALGLDRVSFLGNSFGGTLATHFALKNPERVARIAMMGANLLSFPITPALDRLWGEDALTHDLMTEHMRFFPYNKALITDDLVESRLAACARPEYQAAFRSMFPAPRQKIVDAMALTEEQLTSLECEALLLHGREDVVVPVDVSIRAQALIPRSQLHVFGQCGHWVMIEYNRMFVELMRSFFVSGN
ncbi:alpha/beta fold hydrolase [Aquisediminimonas profunda]|uniref:alpha/beta fold hydrolase n=1 Tax=Aquisediminimonas profunda TaxID=1550733 RepID=UPI001C634D66|nr:alpha/beta hydrolase [Aquisediminimonas profunda]